MSVQQLHNLFVHDLSDMLDAEQRITKMLPVMAQETTDAQMKQALNHHLDETKQQIANIEECFQVLATKPQSVACLAIEGLKKEHDSFKGEKPDSDVLQLFNLGGTCKTEYYEIASYQGLIEKAQLMGQSRCVDLLQQNLAQEQNMAKTAENLSKQIGRHLLA